MLALALLSLIPLISAASTFVGCASVAGGSFSTQSSTSASACASACEQIIINVLGSSNVFYSYYEPQNGGLCTCSGAAPAANTITQSDAGNTDICSNAGQQSVYRIQTTFTFDQCYSGTPIDNRQFVTSLNTCFNNCRSSTTVLIGVVAQTNQYSCYCQGIVDGASGACDPASSFFRYTHSVLQASQGMVRRRKLRNGGGDKYCPAGLTACNIARGVEGYECLDTSSELESCGGCMNGEFGVKRSTVQIQGVNCDEGMTCRVGKCVSQF